MLVAELRGKAGKISRDEDMLTSNVFGTLKNIDRLRGLYALLQLAGIDVTPNEAMPIRTALSSKDGRGFALAHRLTLAKTAMATAPS